jgi:phenylacetate-CoA ligase
MSSDPLKVERAELIRQLRETKPEDIASAGEHAALSAFRRTVHNVPAYRRLVVDQGGIDPDSITDMNTFRSRLPLLDKHQTFGKYPIRELCVGGNLDGVRSLLTSSGHSGVFSFGVNTEENLQRSARSIDMGLQYIFHVDEMRTLLINALPMGVKVHTKATVLAETSVRDDMVYAVVKKFKDEFDQIIIVGEGSFVKKIIEDGRDEHGIDWDSIRVHLITGEEGIAENYRTYIGRLIGLEDFSDRHGKVVMSSMGVAELDLNIFHETYDTVLIRRLAHRDAAVRKALFGDDARFCPMFFIYYPHRCYVEEYSTNQERPEIVMSILSEEMKIPLMRYRTGDYGNIHAYGAVVAALEATGHRFEPDLKLPFVSVYGRGKFIETPHGRLYPEAVKEAIYAVPALAACVTGNFRMTAYREAGAAVHFQLKRDSVLPKGAEADFQTALSLYTDVQAVLRFGAYAEFPYAMEVDYERKFRYV